MKTQKISMFVKNTKPESNATKFNTNLQCGDCLHYKGSRHPAMDKPCTELGIGSKSEAPGCYTPDVTAFRSLGLDAFGVLAAFISTLTPRQSRVLLGVLKYAGSLERHGLQFLEERYFKLGDNYLDNYYKGYVIGVGKNGEFILVGTDYLNCSKASTLAYLDKSSLLDEKRFEKEKTILLSQGRVKSPKVARLVARDEYQVPTIDNEPKGEKKVKKRSGNKDTVTQLRDEDYVIRS